MRRQKSPFSEGLWDVQSSTKVLSVQNTASGRSHKVLPLLRLLKLSFDRPHKKLDCSQRPGVQVLMFVPSLNVGYRGRNEEEDKNRGALEPTAAQKMLLQVALAAMQLNFPGHVRQGKLLDVDNSYFTR